MKNIYWLNKLTKSSSTTTTMIDCVINNEQLNESCQLIFFPLSDIACYWPNKKKIYSHSSKRFVIPRLTLPRLALIRYNAVQLPYIALHCYIVYEG
ncbi:hypothetical protein DERF_004175 [Dermatophagoides farinae]|uniref:Uncharacterized protein n=1 Tax=Dermatophagoides farinae TaxID=6954 RepID=A0A922L4U9_DERFA|nr:hypothetical protein DERF_004175 [Dermatophagoides farinae]